MLEYTCMYAAVPFMLPSFHLSNRTVHVFPSKIKPLHSSQKNPHHNLPKAGSFSGIAKLCYRSFWSFWPFWPKERRLELFPSRCILGSQESLKILFLKISCNSITTEALPGPKKEDHLLEPFFVLLHGSSSKFLAIPSGWKLSLPGPQEKVPSVASSVPKRLRDISSHLDRLRQFNYNTRNSIYSKVYLQRCSTSS